MICVDCRAHPAIRDGNRCRDCLNAYLRATRAPFIPEWRKRLIAKDLTRSAA